MTTTANGDTATVDRLITGTMTKYVLLAVNIALGVFLMPFTVHHLGTSDYGLWMLVASMTAYFGLLDLGYGNGLVRQVADADARGAVDEMNRILSTFVVVYAGIGLAAAAGVAAMVAFVIPRFPNLTPEQVQRARVLLALIGARIALGFPMTVFGAATTARHRFALNNSVAIGIALLNGGVIYVVLATGHGLLTLVAATTAVSLASYALYAWTATIAFPQLRIRPSAFDRRLVRDVTSFSVYLFLIDIAGQIGFNLDNLVIGAAIGTSAVALYAVTVRLADYQRQLCNQFNGLLFPVVVRYGARGESAAVTDLLVDGTRIALVLVTGVTICLVGFAHPLIVRWMGPAFEASVVPLFVLAAAGIIIVGQGPLGNILLATGRHRLVAGVALGEALVNLALSLALVRPFGMTGVALGTALPLVAGNLFVLVPVACRQASIGVGRFARLVGVPAAVGAAPAVAVCVGLRTALPPESMPAILIEGATVALVYTTAVWAFGLDRRVRARYFDRVQRAFAGRPIAGLARARV